MAYLVIYDYGYEGYNYKEFPDLETLLDKWEGGSRHVHEIYETVREVSVNEIATLLEQRKAAKTAAIQAARAKLTPEECELLGIA